MRKQGLGGSDAPAVLGLSPWKSAIELYLDKTTPDLEDTGISPAAELGQELEGYALRKVAELYGAEGYELDGHTYQSALRAWQMCTLDGKLFINGTTLYAEMKTRAFADEWQTSIPDDITAQVQHQMAVMGVDRMLLGVLFRVSGEIQWVEVPRDEEFIGKVLIPAEEKFWDRVQRRDPEGLEVDARKETARALAKLNPEQKDAEPRILSAESMRLVDELVQLRGQNKACSERMDLIRNTLAQEIGECPVGLLPDGRRLNYKTVTRKAYEVKESTYRAVTGPFGKPL
jgi:predicted phage-related endonuclease